MIRFDAIDNGDGTTTIKGHCMFCRKPNPITVETDKYQRYLQPGGHVQRVWPEKTAGEREAITSGSHEACFDKAFGEE